jgi:heme/copper-type cytochrome/quinol oxidase subunit 4
MEAEGGRRGLRYVLPFLVLVALTALELGAIRFNIERAARVTALAGLAMAKAAVLLFVFMDLRSEARALKLLALVPMVLAPVLTVVLMLDAVFRVRAGR